MCQSRTLIEILEAHRLEPATELPADIVLHAVPDPWPFPPHLRVVPEIVAAQGPYFIRLRVDLDIPEQPVEDSFVHDCFPH